MKKLDTSDIKNWPNKVILGEAFISEDLSTDILSSRELEEFNGFRNSGRKAEYISTRKLFRFLLSEMELEVDSVKLFKDKKGKPFAEYFDETINVSFSHSNHKVFCAISKEKLIGLDVESVSRQINAGIIRRILNEYEWEELGKEEPVKLWTIKEATVKCLGTGLRTNLKDLTITKDQKNRFSVRFNNENLFEICSFKQSDHQIALAYQSQHI